MKSIRIVLVLLAVPPVFAAELPVPSATLPESASGASTPDSSRADAYYHVMRARLAAGEGRSVDAVSELREATRLEPESADLHAEASHLLTLMGRRSDAEKMARRAMELDPEHRLALRVLADLAAARTLGTMPDPHSREEAIRLYERLASAPDVDHEVLATLYRLKIQAGDLAGASDVARELVSKRPADVSMVRILAQSLVRQGRTEEALSELLSFLAEHADAVELLPMAADLTRNEEAWSSLERVCGRIVHLRPDNAMARRLRGEALLHLNRPAEAIAELERTLEQAPADPMTRLHLVTAYGGVGRFADAAALAQGLAGQYPDNGGIRAVLGEALARQGDVEGSRRAFAEALVSLSIEDEDSDRRDEVRRRLASLLLRLERSDEAYEVLSSLEGPDSIDSLEVKARVALARNDARDARQVAKKLRALGEVGVATYLEGEAMLREGRLERANARFEEAASLLGQQVRWRISESLREHGHEAAAERLLREWTLEEPGSAEAHLRYGSYLERAGRFDEAEIALRESLRIDPNRPETLNYLGYSLADRNLKLDEALELILRALEFDPWNGAYLDSLGWAYFRMGRYDEAREPLERAAREFPLDPTVLEHLGDLYDRLGDTDSARKAWSRALEHAETEAARSNLESLLERHPDAPDGGAERADRPESP